MALDGTNHFAAGPLVSDPIVKRMLLIGASGQLGGDLVRNNPGYEIIVPGRDQLDLARATDAARMIGDVKPDVVINCAAFHNVPRCEEEPAMAFLINCVAVRGLALACEEIGAQLVTFSSDYVFGGDRSTPWLEDDRAIPIQVYGISRLAGEHAALSVEGARSIVIRTCGLYGLSRSKSKGLNFVDACIAEARTGRPLEIACEQVVSPTFTNDLSLAVYRLIEHPLAKPGIYHLANEGACSWYEFALAIVRLIGVSVDVKPVDRGGRSGNMRRPKYSALGNSKAQGLGISLRPWREALNDYLSEKYPDDSKK